MERSNLGHWLPGRSANPGGRPGVPESLGRPAVQADLTVRGDTSAEHLQALIEVVRKRRAEPIDLDERDVIDVTPRQSDRE